MLHYSVENKYYVMRNCYILVKGKGDLGYSLDGEVDKKYYQLWAICFLNSKADFQKYHQSINQPNNKPTVLEAEKWLQDHYL